MDVNDATEPPDSLLGALAATPIALLPRGIEIDAHYRIERVIGEGGMGVVYLARDLRLDRDVAIKVGVDRSALGRLAREALALARLSHPNVVVIYEVGEHDGHAYVAMEHVRGGTARAWCKKRNWRDIVGLYVAAGDGLVAAHAAGLVHRDFKPDNVLVGSDGRPRVADFGLALPERTDGVGGTPAYMAPEQRAGGEVDARADQYALCVSLQEALAGAKVPRHVEQALRRGLADDPDARWPAVSDLLAELRRDRSRRTTGIAIGIGFIAAATTLGFVTRSDDADPCDAGGEVAWSPSAVRAAIAPAGAPAWRQRDADDVIARLTGWATRYETTTHDVCRAGRVWSPQLHDRGTACLARRAHQLATLLDVLPTGPDNADKLVDQLATPESCGDAAYLAATVVPSSDARVHDVEAELDRAHALAVAGHPDRALAGADARIASAAKLGYAPLAARATFERGFARAIAGDSEVAMADQREAYFGARREQDAELAAAAASGTALMYRLLSKDPQAGEWARLAEVEAVASASPAAQRDALLALGTTADDRGELDAALGYAERFLALARRDPSMLARAYDMREHARFRLGMLAGALADSDEALRVTRARYGDHHPDIARLLAERSLLLDRMHRTDDAIAAATDGLRVAHATDGDDSDSANAARSALAVAYKSAGRFDDALALIDRELAHDRAHDGPRTYNVGSDLNNRGELLMRMTRLPDALASWQESRDIYAEVVGPDGYEVGMVALNVANAMIVFDRPLEAEAPALAAIAIGAKNPRSLLHAEGLIAAGLAQTTRKAWPEAKASLTRGLAELGATSGDANWVARARHALARVLAAEGDRVTARFLANAARDQYVKMGAADTERLAEIDALLKTL